MSDYENNQTAAPVEPEEEITQEKKTQAMLAYILCIPFFTKSYESSDFVKFHLNQGLWWYILTIAFSIIGWVLNLIPIVGTILYMVIYFGLIVFWILGLVSANKMEKKALPLFDKFPALIK